MALSFDTDMTLQDKMLEHTSNNADEFVEVEFSQENISGLKKQKDQFDLASIIRSQPIVLHKLGDKNPTIHMCLKVMIIEQLFKRLRYIRKHLKQKEQVLVDVLLEGKMSFMEDIFKNLKGSGAELRNNLDRDGEPMNILEMAELMVKRIPRTITNSIRRITRLEIDEYFLDLIILRSLNSLSGRMRTKDFVRSASSTIEGLFHPYRENDIEDILEQAETEVRRELLRKLHEQQKMVELKMRLKALKGPTFEERLAALKFNGPGKLVRKSSKKGKGVGRKGKGVGRKSAKKGKKRTGVGRKKGKKTKRVRK